MSGSSSGRRRAGSDSLPRSPPSWRSSLPMRQALSRAPPTPSTADGPRARESSFRGDAKHRTRNLEIPGSRYRAPRNDNGKPNATGLRIMPVTLDPDAAAVFKAFQEAGRPAYERLSAPEAREVYLQARFVRNPEPPEL